MEEAQKLRGEAHKWRREYKNRGMEKWQQNTHLKKTHLDKTRQKKAHQDQE